MTCLTLSSRTLLLLAIAAASVLRLGWYAYEQPAPTSGDPAIYYSLAENLLDLGRYVEIKRGELINHVYFLPGYPVYLSLFLALSRSFLAAALANIVASLVLIPIAYLLVRRLFGNEALALIAAWLCAVQPNFVVYAAAVQSENLFPPLFFGGLFVFIGGSRLTVARAIVAGILLSWACLVRGEGLFYLPCVWFSGILFREERPGLNWKSQWLPLAVLPAIVALILGSWMLRNKQVVGSPNLSSTSGLNFYLAHNEKGYGWQDFDDLTDFLAVAKTDDGSPIRYATPEASTYFMKQGLAHLRENPTALVADVALGTFNLYRPSGSVRDEKAYPAVVAYNLVFWVTLLLLAAGSCLFWRQLNRGALMVLLGIMAMNWLCYAVIFWASPRYRFAMEVIVLIMASACILGLVERRRADRAA